MRQQLSVMRDELAHPLDDNDALCVEVGFETRHGKFNNGKIGFQIGLADVRGITSEAGKHRSM